METTTLPVTTATMLIEGGRTKTVTTGGGGTIITIDHILEPTAIPGTTAAIIKHQLYTLRLDVLMMITQAAVYFNTCVSWDCQSRTILSFTGASTAFVSWRCRQYLMHASLLEQKDASYVTCQTSASTYTILKSTNLATNNARHLLPLLLLACQEGIHSFPAIAITDRMGGGASSPHQRRVPDLLPSLLRQDTAHLLLSLQLILEVAIPISTSIQVLLLLLLPLSLQLIVVHTLIMTRMLSPPSPCV